MMNTVKITFSPKTFINDEEEVLNLFWSYLATLYRNGQILENFLLLRNNDQYISFATLPEDDALDEKYNSRYTTEDLDKIKALFAIATEQVGEDMNTGPSCACTEKPDWYWLYTHLFDKTSPVVCGQCGHSVPLYKLPHIMGDGEYGSVQGWQGNYKAIDELFIACFSDQYTYRQMNKLDSLLSKEGREICQAFEEATSVPFYYYLHYYEKEPPAACPSCSEDWKLTGETSFIEYKCDKCRLVASWIDKNF